MRVFCAIRHSTDARFYYGGLWSANFYPALRALGCEIVESQTDLLSTSRFMAIADEFTPEELETRAQTTEKILDEVREAKRRGSVHLFLSYFYNAHFDPAGFNELRRLGIPSINFYCNSIYQFALVAAVAPSADFSWHPERDARAAYLAVGANPVWVQMGADSGVCHPVNGIERQPKACFVGQRYADRDRWIAALVNASVPVDVYGGGWGGEQAAHPGDFSGMPVYLGRKQFAPGSLDSYFQLMTNELEQHGIFGGAKKLISRAAYRRQTRRLAQAIRPRAMGRADDLTRVFAAYDVCLNFSNVWADGRPGSALVPHVRLRDFEAPMSRTCYLTGDCDEIREFYTVGREIETYRDEPEFVDKVRFYLANPDAAARIRQAGYCRALRDHTWRCRFEKLFAKIGLRG